MSKKEESSAMTTIVEGSTSMTFPADQQSTVFYNPVQVQNRDLSVLMIALYAERRAIRHAVKMKKKELRGVDDRKRLLEDYEKTLDGRALIQSNGFGSSSTTESSTTNDSFSGLAILDALAASGLRSIRYWKEIPGVRHVTINDLDPAAVERAHNNLKLNDLTHILLKDNTDRSRGIAIQTGDATHELYLSRKPQQLHDDTSPFKTQWDVIDLDPYGSAAPFLDAAVQSIESGGLLCVTCTDMAALGGSHPETCYGRYAAFPIQRAKYLQEFALRILLQSIAHTAARYGRTIRPILSVGMDFYVRVFVEIHNDKAGVNHLSTMVGMVYQSTQCPSFHTVSFGQHGVRGKNVYQPSRAPKYPTCEETGGPFKVGGPIWLGPLHDADVVKTALQRLDPDASGSVKNLATQERLYGLLTSVSEELNDVPLFYDLPHLCQTLKCASPPLIKVKAALVNAGYRVSGYHKVPSAIKTDAPNRVVWDILRTWCQSNPPKNVKDVGEQILSVKPETQVDFTVPASWNLKKKVKRFPENPEKHWGPKRRASGQKRKANEPDKL